MFKLVTFFALVAAVSGFAPAQHGKTATALTAKYELTEGGLLGAQAPLGVFDPLNMLKGGKINGPFLPEKFDRLRYVEIKHGRICMLAFLGQITTRYGIHFSGPIDKAGDTFASYPNGLAALFGPDAIPTYGLWQIIAFVGFLEIGVMKDSANGAEPGEFVGDFRNGSSWDFGWYKLDEETKLEKRAIELNNGRAAMMGVLGLMVHEKLNEVGVVADLPIIGVLE